MISKLGSARQALTAVVIAAAFHSPALSQSGPVREAVFVHGALGNQYDWATAVSQLSSSYTFPLTTVAIPGSVALSGWGAYLTPSMIADSTVLVGHSIGGLASRHASASVAAKGVVTVGTPHAGVPITGMVEDLIGIGEIVIFDAFYIFDYLTYAVFTSYVGEAYAQAVVAFVDSWAFYFVDALVNSAMSYLATYPPDILIESAPNSSYLVSLPAAGSNSFALRVSMWPGQLGGPLALLPDIDQEQADEIGQDIYYWGEQIGYYAAGAEGYLDVEDDGFWFAYNAIQAAYEISFLMTNMWVIWCDAVNGGAYSCASNDGFIPVASQSATGFVIQNLNNGPAHTKETSNSSVIGYVGQRLCLISGEC